MRADILANGDLRACGRGRTGLCLAYTGERQRAERGESTSSQTGTAQEGAAVEAAISVMGQAGGE
jgi:hypothetical protein